jgi:hypothetical protein
MPQTIAPNGTSALSTTLDVGSSPSSKADFVDPSPMQNSPFDEEGNTVSPVPSTITAAERSWNPCARGSPVALEDACIVGTLNRRINNREAMVLVQGKACARRRRAACPAFFGHQSAVPHWDRERERDDRDETRDVTQATRLWRRRMHHDSRTSDTW